MQLKFCDNIKFPKKFLKTHFHSPLMLLNIELKKEGIKLGSENTKI